MTAVVVLGMHRSGTSCIAGMIAAARHASAGAAVRNWDNPRGHHEMLDAIRLDEAVLAHSGGHWLGPPPAVRWTDAHAAERDRLLAARIDGVPALLKDPRMLLVLPFWRATRVPMRIVAVVRHPLAVARSLEAWRGIPLAEGIALWTAHNRALRGQPVIDFDRPKDDVVAALHAQLGGDRAALADVYDERLVHHDDGDPPDGLAEAVALHAALVGHAQQPHRPAFPRRELVAFAQALAAGRLAEASRAADAAAAAIADPAAVLVPVVTALVRAGAFAEALALIAAHARGELADLLRGKVLLAAGDPAGALAALATCSLYQARALIPQALRGAGRRSEARAALQALVGTALYPHGPLATLAEWSWLDGDRDTALVEMAQAIAAAPLHRHGRLRTRRAEWLLAQGDHAGARAELDLAIAEDPGYARSRDVRARLPEI